jgi:hypothetical protein
MLTAGHGEACKPSYDGAALYKASKLSSDRATKHKALMVRNLWQTILTVAVY